ncbi:hypothetical protein MK805_01380 [Shimazuella sp. AN120528]|uniref:hypothetical protein n=1 Tax=Shimazuella soli TaxID=1892854 RepID=UPI001F10C918|nr:hypothetical protein [Shimazuella soli]MCH5583623.1 hypothetical protein [Shimazuella soli]
MQQTTHLLRKILLLILPFLLIGISFATTYAQETASIGNFQIWYVQDGKKHVVKESPTAKYEMEQLLNKIDHLAGLSSFQLPTRYILVQFHHPVVLSAFSPIKHPFQSVIVTIPKNHNEIARLLIRNSQGSWVEYHTERSLSIFLQQIIPSSLKDDGII